MWIARRSLSLALMASVVAACSSGSSGGSSPTPSRPASAGGVDRAAVASVLSHVLIGLRTVTSISRHAGFGQAAASLQSASNELAAAGRSLNPTPTGVPTTTALPVSTGLLRISGLLHQSSTCLARQPHAASPSAKPCLSPLQQANAKTGALAHELVSLAVYGRQSPKTFESDLVDALHGR
jgi:hypothetical protein